MTGTLLTVVLFRSSENLAAAYGIAVSGTMLITTILLYRVAVSRWRWPPGVAIPVIAIFGAIDATFLVSNSIKITEGGWFPLIVGAAIAAPMLSWRKGSSEVRLRLEEMSMPLKEFLEYADKTCIGRAPGMGVWLTKVGSRAGRPISSKFPTTPSSRWDSESKSDDGIAAVAYQNIQLAFT